MTTAQPYRGRHSTPDPELPASLAAAPPASFPGPEPAAVPVAQPVVQPMGAPPLPGEEWVAYPPPVPYPQPAPVIWDAPPPGFVPLPPVRSTNRGRVLLCAAVAAVVLAAAGWFGYQAISAHDPAPATLVQPVAGAAGDAGGAGGVDYTSTDGHFRVGLAAQPQIVTQNTTFGSYSFKLTIAADPVGRVAAGGITVTPDAPTEAISTMLRGFVAGLQRDGSVSDVAMGTYQGHPSVSATVTKSTGSEVVLAYAYTPSRMYMLVAADRASLTALETRFQPLP